MATCVLYSIQISVIEAPVASLEPAWTARDPNGNWTFELVLSGERQPGTADPQPLVSPRAPLSSLPSHVRNATCVKDGEGIHPLIPEVEDHFAVAESRCDDLQEKIDLVKLLKRKKKLNKRSVTRVNESAPVSENMPFISVRTQPKKKVSQQAARTRRAEPPAPARGYVDPATVEQHRMLGQVWGYGRNYAHQNEIHPEHQKLLAKMRPRINRADGDGTCGLVMEKTSAPADVACGQDEEAETSIYSDLEIYDHPPGDVFAESAETNIHSMKKRKNEIMKKTEAMNDKHSNEPTATLRKSLAPSSANRRPKQPSQQHNHIQTSVQKPKPEERPVVELFTKSRPRIMTPVKSRSPRLQTKKEDKPVRNSYQEGDQTELNASRSYVSIHSAKKAVVRRRARHRNYELPTLASQLKQADARYHCSVSNCSNLPFVVSKSTAPSHNIGVNLQQVLNGVKMQLPVNGIPMTIAHHMGLGHVSTYKKANKPPKQSLDRRLINAITVGRRLLTLPSYRSISYSRLLALYREGEGMVPRFLRAMSRPNYIYTSMYDLSQPEETENGAAAPAGAGAGGGAGAAGGGAGGAGSVDDDTKRRLAEYADVYAEYEKLDALRKQGGPGGAEAERRCDELLRELLAREEIIKQLMDNATTLAMPSAVKGGEARAPSVADGRRAKRDC